MLKAKCLNDGLILVARRISRPTDRYSGLYRPLKYFDNCPSSRDRLGCGLSPTESCTSQGSRGSTSSVASAASAEHVSSCQSASNSYLRRGKSKRTHKRSGKVEFLVADTQLYKRLCPSVRPLYWSVGPLVCTSQKVGIQAF